MKHKTTKNLAKDIEMTFLLIIPGPPRPRRLPQGEMPRERVCHHIQPYRRHRSRPRPLQGSLHNAHVQEAGPAALDDVHARVSAAYTEF